METAKDKSCLKELPWAQQSLGKPGRGDDYYPVLKEPMCRRVKVTLIRVLCCKGEDRHPAYPKCSIQPREQRIRAACIRAVLFAPLGCRGQGSLNTRWLLLQPFCAVLAGLLTAKSDLQQLTSPACKEADRGCFTFPLAIAFFTFVLSWSLCHILAWAA